MNIVNRVSKWLMPLAVLLCLASVPSQAASELALPPPAVKLSDNQVLKVYYFHGNARCTSCKLIEKYTKAAIEQGYQQSLQQGVVELQMVNLESKGNDHYIDDFQLITRSVVLAIEQNGKVVDYRRLDAVWQLFTDEQKFTNYIYREIGEITHKQVALQPAIESAYYG
ncbi:nitrophenyl compound nitroreductase subunit ArsF family protein [Shewanella halifaxensis]|uniref:nitrophenyl compound nitroreductase subunit ArsF family protein n=1 Tax=Shewanella halifaxensis TaxID=271098 RepID=UPI000D590736|nr:nitrophenyl compound nitroreductase subunit ArsF family protein [Shewanella halifaxensis]